MQTFKNDGLVFDVIDEGPVDGDVVILLHGFPESNEMWADVVPRLTAVGLRVLAPDQRGYSERRPPDRAEGLSAEPADRRHPRPGRRRRCRPVPPRRPRLGGRRGVGPCGESRRSRHDAHLAVRAPPSSVRCVDGALDPTAALLVHVRVPATGDRAPGSST